MNIMPSDSIGYSLAPNAQADLEGIWRYSAENWSVAQADKYVGELSEIFELIGSMPMMARERPEFVPPVRIHVHQKHLIIYVIGNNGIEILRILGGQQDWLAILKDAEP